MILRYFARIGTALLLMILVWSCGTVPGLQEEKVPETSVIIIKNCHEIFRPKSVLMIIVFSTFFLMTRY